MTRQPPIWYHDLREDAAFWAWYTTGILPFSASATLRNCNVGSRDSILDTLYIWWKMGGKELTAEQVLVVSQIWFGIKQEAADATD